MNLCVTIFLICFLKFLSVSVSEQVRESEFEFVTLCCEEKNLSHF